MNKALFYLFLLISPNLSSQTLSTEWASEIEGISFNSFSSITTDEHDNVYVTGNYFDSIDVDPSVNTYYLKSSGAADYFLVKYNSEGELKWAYTFGSTQTEKTYKVKYSNGKIFVSGYTQSNIDFDPSSISVFNVYPFTSFIQILDTNGIFFNAYFFGGNNNSIYDFDINPINNEITLACNILNSLDVDPSLVNNIIYGYGVVLIQFSILDGTLVNYKFIDNPTSSLIPNDVIYDFVNDNYYVSFLFQSSIDLNPDLGVNNYTSNGGKDIAIIKFSNNLTYINGFQIGSNLDEKINDMILDPFGNLICSGNFKNQCNFNPLGIVNNLTSSGNDIFISKYNSNLELDWINQYATLDSTYIYNLAGDSFGNIYFAGEFVGTLDMDPSSGISNLSESGKTDIFIGKLNNFGMPIYSEKFGSSKFDKCKNIAISNTDDVIIVGTFQIQIDLDLNGSNYDLTGPFIDNLFISKFHQGPLSIKDFSFENSSLVIYPNPSNTSIRISDLSITTEVKISIYNSEGKCVFNNNQFLSSLIDISKLTNGIYFIQVFSEGEYTIGKFIVEY